MFVFVAQHSTHVARQTKVYCPGCVTVGKSGTQSICRQIGVAASFPSVLKVTYNYLFWNFRIEEND